MLFVSMLFVVLCLFVVLGVVFTRLMQHYQQLQQTVGNQVTKAEVEIEPEKIRRAEEYMTGRAYSASYRRNDATEPQSPGREIFVVPSHKTATPAVAEHDTRNALIFGKLVTEVTKDAEGNEVTSYRREPAEYVQVPTDEMALKLRAESVAKHIIGDAP
jgi:hypothetical protein